MPRWTGRAASTVVVDGRVVRVDRRYRVVDGHGRLAAVLFARQPQADRRADLGRGLPERVLQLLLKHGTPARLDGR